MEDIEWSPWIEHDGTDRCPEVAKELPCSIWQGLGSVLGGRGASIGRGGSWRPVNRYRIPMADYLRIYGAAPDAPTEEKKVYARAPEGCETYLTPGKVYEVGDDSDITDDENDILTVMFGHPSRHLNGGNWGRLVLTEAEAAEINANLRDALDSHPDSEPDADQYTVGADAVTIRYNPDDVKFHDDECEAPLTEHDTVNAPSHYASGEIECIDAIKASMTAEEFEGYCKGNVQKYMWRWRAKGGVESLRKAEWYLRRLIDVVE